ncbi:MAG: virulence RhuM family protein [Candidatus Margulisbacteria bacterium]|nr:virulence RhuM family protein [Candidatus Margulisiibacteriota bacterium]
MSESKVLIYQNDNGDIKLDVRFEKETVWLTIDHIATLFKKSRSTVNEHILNVYNEGELEKETCMRKIGISDFSTKPTNYYNLDVIISVGYRVKSKQGTQFRIWATQRLRDYIIKGFALNDDRFKTGQAMTYFDELQDRIREIRLSERFFYQKIKDIYTTSIDYDSKDKKTMTFFKIVQNKLLWAISKKTAAELVHHRVDATLPLMGMQSLDKKGNKSLQKKDTSIAKNYLAEDEIKLLGLLVEQYLAFAETMAQQQTPMTMKDWASRLDAIIQLNGKELLTHAGKISHELAEKKAELEYKRFKKLSQKKESAKNLDELANDIKRLKKKP